MVYIYESSAIGKGADMDGKSTDLEPDQFSKEETEQRLKAMLRGAFAGSPTPLKDIPKKGGESRAKRAITGGRRKPKKEPRD